MGKLPWKKHENAKKKRRNTNSVQDMIRPICLLCETVFWILCFIDDLSTEWFFDETSKEFLVWRQKSTTSYTKFRRIMKYSDWFQFIIFLPNFSHFSSWFTYSVWGRHKDQTINKEYYLQVMKRWHDRIRRKCPHLWASSDGLLHHNNTPAHVSNLVVLT